MIYLISPDKKQYKANLHCHSVLSDGHKTPAELAAMYKSRGYDILSITDHERPCDHSELGDKDLIMITGYEAYIRPDPKCIYDIYGQEIHMNLFARDPKNIKMICPNKFYCKYLNRDGASHTEFAGSDRTREYTVEYINEFIRTANENGYLVTYNHPYWSMESEANILAYEGYFSLEITNYGSYVTGGLEHDGAVYDKMLCAGKRVFCHGADDNHNVFDVDDPASDSFGAFTMIMPDRFDYSGIIDAMDRGEMYSSMGPLFKEVSIDEGNVHIECSDVAHIYMYVGSKSPKYLHARAGEVINSADFALDPRARYVRVSVCDREGRWADTRGFFRDEIGLE